MKATDIPIIGTITFRRIAPNIAVKRAEKKAGTTFGGSIFISHRPQIKSENCFLSCKGSTKICLEHASKRETLEATYLVDSQRRLAAEDDAVARKILILRNDLLEGRNDGRIAREEEENCQVEPLNLGNEVR